MSSNPYLEVALPDGQLVLRLDDPNDPLWKLELRRHPFAVRPFLGILPDGWRETDPDFRGARMMTCDRWPLFLAPLRLSRTLLEIDLHLRALFCAREESEDLMDEDTREFGPCGHQIPGSGTKWNRGVYDEDAAKAAKKSGREKRLQELREKHGK